MIPLSSPVNVQLHFVRAPRAAGPDVETAPGTEVVTKVIEEVAPPWNVVALNDPVNLMSYVSMVIQRIFGYSKTKAETLMLQVHQDGRSIVWTGDREAAEGYVEQLHGYQLMAVLEKAEL